MYKYIEGDGNVAYRFQSGESMGTYLDATEFPQRSEPAGRLANVMYAAGGLIMGAGIVDGMTHSHIADKIPYMSDPRTIAAGAILTIASFVAEARHKA